MMNKQAFNTRAFEKNIVDLLKKNKFSGFRSAHSLGGSAIGAGLGAGLGALDVATSSDIPSEEKGKEYLKRMALFGGAGGAVGGGLGYLKGRRIRNALIEKEMFHMRPQIHGELDSIARMHTTPQAKEVAINELRNKLMEGVQAISPEEYASSGRNVMKEIKQRKREVRESEDLAMRQKMEQRRAYEEIQARRKGIEAAQAAADAHIAKGTLGLDEKWIAPPSGPPRTFADKILGRNKPIHPDEIEAARLRAVAKMKENPSPWLKKEIADHNTEIARLQALQRSDPRNFSTYQAQINRVKTEIVGKNRQILKYEGTPFEKKIISLEDELEKTELLRRADPSDAGVNARVNHLQKDLDYHKDVKNLHDRYVSSKNPADKKNLDDLLRMGSPVAPKMPGATPSHAAIDIVDRQIEALTHHVATHPVSPGTASTHQAKLKALLQRKEKVSEILKNIGASPEELDAAFSRFQNTRAPEDLAIYTTIKNKFELAERQISSIMSRPI